MIDNIINGLLSPEIIAGGVVGIVFTLIVFYLTPMCWRWIISKFILSSILKGEWIHYYHTYNSDNKIVSYSSKIKITPSFRYDFDIKSYNDKNQITAKGYITKDSNNSYHITIKAVHHSDISYIIFHEPRWNNNDTYFIGFSQSHDTNHTLTNGVSIFSKKPFEDSNTKIKEILQKQISIDTEYKVVKKMA